MDISIIYSLSAVVLPLLYALYLSIARVRLSLVPKKVLNYGLIFINFISFILFCYLFYFIQNTKQEITSILNVFSYDKLDFNFGILLNEGNIKFLLFSNLIYLLISLYSKFYFEQKKQFIFTKQRFYIYLSFLIFNTYVFLISPNLFQNFVFWVLQGMIIYIFAYFDIFKEPTNFNITRFARISIIGDFSFLMSVLVLFKNALLSQGYIKSFALDFSELNVLFSYTFAIAEKNELLICTVCFLIALASKMLIFPFSCYYSFFANSSNIFYLSIIGCANSLLGVFVFCKLLPLLSLYCNAKIYLIAFLIFSAILSIFFVLFEKNYKIIFGYLNSAFNSGFLIAYLFFSKEYLLYVYFGFNFLITLVLMFLFLNNKVGLNKRPINKQKGFLLEGCHIFVFETVPSRFFAVANFIDEKIVQNFVEFYVLIFNHLISVFNIKMVKNNPFKSVRNIFIIFGLFTIFAILIALFGRFK